jgi:hypothetical protein
MNVSHHSPATLFPDRMTPRTTGGWLGLKTVWTIGEEKKMVAPAKKWTTIHRLSGP